LLLIVVVLLLFLAILWRGLQFLSHLLELAVIISLIISPVLLFSFFGSARSSCTRGPLRSVRWLVVLFIVIVFLVLLVDALLEAFHRLTTNVLTWFLII